MTHKKPYCLMPFIHLHIGDNGEAKACCVANIKFGNINKLPLEQVWDNEAINNIRSKFINNTPDKRCAVCLNIEKSGATSIRQETHENYKNLEIDYNNPTLPIYFDIRFSNVCNLKCRTCWHGASSSWFEDAKILKTNKGKKAVIKNINDFDSFIEKTGLALQGAKEIYLAGGEPLVTEEHYLLLQWLIDHKLTDIKLRYNTNLTILKYKGKSVIDYWKQFKNVEILASIDANNDLASYVRTNSNWESIKKNIQVIKSLSHISVQISPTISILNVEFIPELINECISLNFITEDDIYINILERPIHYNIQVFPTEIKSRIENKLFQYKSSLTSQKFISQINEIIQYMNSQDQSIHWPKFTLENKKLDHLRNEKSILPYY